MWCQDMNIHIQESQWIPSKINSKRSTLRHIIIKFSKGRGKERVFKNSRRKTKNSLPVQWLGICTFTAKGVGLVPGQGARILLTWQLPILPRNTQENKETHDPTISYLQETHLKSKDIMTLCDPLDYIACHAHLSMEFCRQEHWSGLASPSLGDLPNPEIETRSSALQAGSLLCEPSGNP